MSKLCLTCSVDQPVENFYKRLASKDGLFSKCKICSKAYDDARASCPKRAEARAAYAQTEKGRERHNNAKVKYIERNPKKRAAHIQVGNALRDGKLEKSDVCEFCWEHKPLVAHHPDYNQPLMVLWFCSQCHDEWHRQNGEGLNG